ncbi:hypothetical protein CPC08DRAFT_820322 [Agrocybe pediades]|nr:hypothetical protein CPC08DRAFT_820322 [Agrocybe pediades]
MPNPVTTMPASDVVAGLAKLELDRYSRLAMAVVMCYDYALTIDREIDLIWRSKWSLPKVLFLLTRYYGLSIAVFGLYILFGDQSTDEVSLAYLRWSTFSAYSFSLLTQGVLQIRVYALYNSNKRILAFMLLFFVTSTVVAGRAAIGEMVLFRPGNVKSIDLAGTRMCTNNGLPGPAYLLWVAYMAFESMLCVLVLYKGYQTFFLDGLPFTGRNLLDIMVRDSATVFLLMTAAYTACLVVVLATTPDHINIPAVFSLMLSEVLCTRMVLNLRQAGKHTEEVIYLTTLS